MKSMRMLLALAIATPLAAQQPDTAKHAMPMGPGMGREMMHGQMGAMQGPDMMEHMAGMMGHMMEMMGPMMRSMAFEPDHLLARKDALELTPQQVTRLTALRDAAKTAQDAAQSDMKTHMDELARVMKASAPDTAQLKQHFQAAQAAMGRAHWTMLSAAAQARAILTDAQRGRVDGWADMMMPMMRQHENAPEH
jgi:LTXXQ motif family protein